MISKATIRTDLAGLNSSPLRFDAAHLDLLRKGTVFPGSLPF